MRKCGCLRRSETSQRVDGDGTAWRRQEDRQRNQSFFFFITIISNPLPPAPCRVMKGGRETWRLHFASVDSPSCCPIFNFMAFLFDSPQAAAIHGHYTPFPLCHSFELYLSCCGIHISLKLTVFQWLHPGLHNGMHYCPPPPPNPLSEYTGANQGR